MDGFVVLETIGDPKTVSSHRDLLEASGIQVLTEKLMITADRKSVVSGYRVFVPSKDRYKASTILREKPGFHAYAKDN